MHSATTQSFDVIQFIRLHTVGHCIRPHQDCSTTYNNSSDNSSSATTGFIGTPQTLREEGVQQEAGATAVVTNTQGGGGHNKKQGQPQWAFQRGGFLYYRGSVASSPALTIIFRIYSIVRQVTHCFVVAIIYEIKGTVALRYIERFNQWRAAGEMADRTVFLACGQWLI